MPESRDPYCKQLSEDVKLLYGFKDARAELKIRLPGGIPLTVKLDADRVKAIKEAFDAAHAWAILPDAERAEPKLAERALDDRGKAKWGFKDAHIELTARATRFLPWVPFSLSKDELLVGKPAMDEVWAWAQLPADVRAGQGIE